MFHWGWLLVPVIIGMVQQIIWKMTLQLAKSFGDIPASVILHFIGALFGGVLVAFGLKGGDGAI